MELTVKCSISCLDLMLLISRDHVCFNLLLFSAEPIVLLFRTRKVKLLFLMKLSAEEYIIVQQLVRTIQTKYK